MNRRFKKLTLRLTGENGTAKLKFKDIDREVLCQDRRLEALVKIYEQTIPLTDEERGEKPDEN